MSLKDIKEGNIVYVDEIDYDGDDVALVTVVTDNKVEGEVGRVKTDRIEIDKKEIKVVKTKKDNEEKFHAGYTTDSYDEVKNWVDDSNWEDDMEDAYKKDAVAYKDAVGRIAFVELGSGNSGYKFGIVTRTYADGDRVRIFTTIDGKEGKDQIFKADKENDLKEMKSAIDEKSLKGEQTLLGSAVKFRLNSDGEIADGKFFVMPKDQIYAMTDDFGKDVIKAKKVNWNTEDKDVIKGAKGVSFVVPTDSVDVISAEGLTKEVMAELANKEDYKVGNLDGIKNLDVDDFDTTTWKDIKDDKFDSSIRFYVFSKSQDKEYEVDGLVFVGQDGANTGSDEIAVYVLDKWRAGDDIKVEYVSYENNEKQVRVVDDSEDGLLKRNIEKETAYVGKEKSNGKIALYGGKDNEKLEDYKVYRGLKVKSVKGNYIELDGKAGSHDRLYVSGALIYDEDKTKSISYLEEKVIDVVTDGIRTRVVSVEPESDKKDDDKETTNGVVNYINDERIFIDNDKYKMDADTILYDTDGKTIKAVGGVNIHDNTNGLKLDSVVKNVKTKGDLVTEMTLVGDKEGLAEKEAQAFIKIWDEEEEDVRVDKIEAAKTLEDLNKMEEVLLNLEKEFNKLSSSAQKIVLDQKDYESVESKRKPAIESKRAELNSELENDKNLVKAAKEVLEKEEDIEVKSLDADSVKGAIEEKIKQEGVKVSVEVQNASPKAEVRVTLTKGSAKETVTVVVVKVEEANK